MFCKSLNRGHGIRHPGKVWLVGGLVLAAAVALSLPSSAPRSLAADEGAAEKGQDIFRFDTFGDEQVWTDRLRIHEVIESSIDPATALALGLKVDADALPDSVKTALRNGQVDLTDPAVTVALIKLNAVVGIVGRVQNMGGRDRL